MSSDWSRRARNPTLEPISAVSLERAARAIGVPVRKGNSGQYR